MGRLGRWLTVFDFRSSLAQIRPFLGSIEKAMLVGSLGGPDYAGGGARWIKASMRLVTFMSFAKLLMDRGVQL